MDINKILFRKIKNLNSLLTEVLKDGKKDYFDEAIFKNISDFFVNIYNKRRTLRGLGVVDTKIRISKMCESDKSGELDEMFNNILDYYNRYVTRSRSHASRQRT